MISYEGNKLITVQDAAKALGITEEEALAEMKRAGVPAVSLPMVVFPCPQCGTTIERVMENPAPEILLTCPACKCEAEFRLISGTQWGVRVLEKGLPIPPPSAHELAFEAEKKKALAEGGTVLETLVEMHGSIEAVKQNLIDQAQRDPKFRETMLHRGKEDWAESLEERRIPYVLTSGKEKRYSLVAILEAYSIPLHMFLQQWGIQWKGLTAGENPYLTIQEMWDRDIYPAYLKKTAEGR